jgi:hypothetical protein
MRTVGIEQGVAVARRLGNQFRRDGAAGAGPVVDQELLAQVFGELLRHRTRRDLDRTPGGERHDDAHRLGRIGYRLRAGDDWKCGRGDDAGSAGWKAKPSAVLHVPPAPVKTSGHRSFHLRGSDVKPLRCRNPAPAARALRLCRSWG